MPVDDLYLYVSMTFILVFILFLYGFKSSYYENTRVQILFCLVFSAFVGAGAVTLTLGILDFMRGNFNPTESKLVVIVCGAIAGAASRLLNIILRRVNGLMLVDIRDLQLLTAEQPIQNIECLFRKDPVQQYAAELLAAVERMLKTREVCHETSGELSGGRSDSGPVLGLSADRNVTERESAVDK